MIAHIRGVLTDMEEGALVLEAGGVGYRLLVPHGPHSPSFVIGEEVQLYTYLSYSQDGFTLFGFYSKDEEVLFRMLIGVSGIGPKGAVSVLSALSADELRYAIYMEDAAAISAAQGIGKKTAQKVILELHDKIGSAIPSEFLPAADTAAPAEEGPYAEAIEALTALGYKRTEAAAAVRRQPAGLTVEEILRAALRDL